MWNSDFNDDGLLYLNLGTLNAFQQLIQNVMYFSGCLHYNQAAITFALLIKSVLTQLKFLVPYISFQQQNVEKENVTYPHFSKMMW